MKFLVFIAFIANLLSIPLCAQGLIVNELSNGASGVQEYIELLVIPNPSSLCTNVDVSGWIIDDNNGSFEGSVSTGVAQGHFRIKSGCYTNLAPGSILLIYNANDKFAGIPADDPNDSNNDKIYIIPHTYTCIEVCTTLPSAASISYTPAVYVATTSTSWSVIGMANSGDAVQTRKPNYSFFHGFSYGDVGAPFPTYPAQLGGGSAFNVSTGSGTNSSYIYSCGSIINANYTKVAASAGSPGATNSSSNLNFITNIQNCKVDWSDLSNTNYCDFVLDPIWLNLNIEKYNNEILIKWETTLSGIFSIQEYINSNWNYITNTTNNFTTFKSNASIFRIQYIDIDGNINYSPIMELLNNNNTIYIDNNIIVNSLKEKLTICNSLGQIINTSYDNIDIQTLSPGIYFYYTNTKIFKFIKN